MRTSKLTWPTAALVASLLSCAPGAPDGEPPREQAEPAAPAAEMAPAAGPEPNEWPMVEATLTAAADSIDRLLRRVPNLNQAERGALRRDVNAVQTARARQLGVPARSEIDPLIRDGRLVPLADSSRYWVVRQLDFSVPYVTPDTETMLVVMGERFHARLDSLGLPRYRMEITSVLRTREHQQALQRRNPNAAAGISAHEYGTTVDVAYRRFGPPAEVTSAVLEGRLAGDPRVRQLSDSLLVEVGALRGAELQAVLGRVIREMREEGKLLVMMEIQQTVYHMTVARRFPERRTAPAAE